MKTLNQELKQESIRNLLSLDYKHLTLRFELVASKMTENLSGIRTWKRIYRVYVGHMSDIGVLSVRDITVDIAYATGLKIVEENKNNCGGLQVVNAYSSAIIEALRKATEYNDNIFYEEYGHGGTGKLDINTGIEYDKKRYK